MALVGLIEERGVALLVVVVVPIPSSSANVSVYVSCCLPMESRAPNNNGTVLLMVVVSRKVPNIVSIYTHEMKRIIQTECGSLCSCHLVA